ncbi:MAG: DUF3108 domain-containing protein [Candidatus Cloacimonetes bacterium]|nr:DUF3108 domain-containing protein [Candidatus Cloacimonadota bacterium]
MKYLIIAIVFMLISPLTAINDGEILEFDINYGVIHAGDVRMTVSTGTWQDSIPTFIVLSEARTVKFFDNFYKVRDRIEIEFYQADFQSIRYHKQLREGSYVQNRINYYYPQLGYAILFKKDKKATEWTEKSFDIPEKSNDIFTTFFKVREYDFAVGDTIPVTISEDGKNTTIDIVIHRIKKIDTIFGKIDCYEMEPQLKDTESIFKQSGEIYIYLTADERKIPVLLQSQVIFGKFKATLEAYKPGK